VAILEMRRDDMIDYTVIVNTQDPWVTFFSQVSAAIIGGIIALGANYFLQKRSFNAHIETNQKILGIAYRHYF
jgi:hypothetical protein